MKSNLRHYIEARDKRNVPVPMSSTDFVAASVAPVVPIRYELTPEGRVAVEFTTTVAGEYTALFTAGVSRSPVAGNWPEGTDARPLRIQVDPAPEADASKTEVLKMPKVKAVQA